MRVFADHRPKQVEEIPGGDRSVHAGGADCRSMTSVGSTPRFATGTRTSISALRLSERGFDTHYCHESVLIHLESVSRQIPTSGQLPRHEIEHNTKLYADRWLDRVQPDDLNHYLEDGLVKDWLFRDVPASDGDLPELAVLLEGEHEAAADRLLRTRSRQLYELLRRHPPGRASSGGGVRRR